MVGKMGHLHQVAWHMSEYLQFLPAEVIHLLRSHAVAEYATVSGAGLPIDTPTFYFPSADLSTLDIGTGLGYPAKAERARKNPKVGMLIEGAANDPVISIAGIAAVRDSDLQANLNRYAAETIFSPNINPDVVGWDHVRERKGYYLARMLVCIKPAHIRWWRNRAAMDDLPQEWRAAANTIYPVSDPMPPGNTSSAPLWSQQTWQALAQNALQEQLPAHLTLLDDNGHPIPIRVGEYALHAEGFRLSVPKGAPWCEGKATLSFVGKQIFVGDAIAVDGETLLRVERALPVLPLMTGVNKETVAVIAERVKFEAERRGQAVPTVPRLPPDPTEGAKLRRAAAKELNSKAPGRHATIK